MGEITPEAGVMGDATHGATEGEADTAANGKAPEITTVGDAPGEGVSA